MSDNLEMSDMSNSGQCDNGESYGAYFKRAAAACEAGDSVLGMHLYLAAYEKAAADPSVPTGMAVAGLREAWDLACSLKERSMAEYVFEKLEPFLSGEEIARCANELQDLALDRLEEYGFSREELQDMAEMISQDLVDGEGSIVKVESISFARRHGAEQPNEDDPANWAYGRNEAYAEDVAPAFPDEAQGGEVSVEQPQEDKPASDAHQRGEAEDAAPSEPRKREKVGMGVAPADNFNPYDYYDTSSVGKSYHVATNEGSGSYVFTRDNDRASQLAASQLADEAESGQPQATQAPEEPSADAGFATASEETYSSREGGQEIAAPTDASQSDEAAIQPKGERAPVEAAAEHGLHGASRELPTIPDIPSVGERVFNYSALAGYADAISLMRDFGIGMQRDPGFRNFIGMMNARHGLDRMPALDTLLFRAPAIEDAARFADATLGEIHLPVLRMSMEEGMQGMPVLCVTTQGNNRPRLNQAQNRFEGPGVLLIEELDMWVIPQPPEGVEGIAGFMMANMSRGAREAMNMIRSAVENPDVFVIATTTTSGEVDPFFYELLDPISIIDIGLPTDEERDDIWREVMNDHPSMRALNRADLVRYSAGLPRYDIYMAARAALEEAYKAGLVERKFLPVTNQNALEKLASYQPLDSEEYRALEDELVRELRADLDNLEGLLG